MTFENIKVGDTVYITKYVSYGWNKGQTFEVAVKVERVSPTQFTADGNKYRKSNGQMLGEYTNAKLDGKDETAAMQAFEAKLKLAKIVGNMLTETKIKVSHTVEQLQALESALLEFQKSQQQ